MDLKERYKEAAESLMTVDLSRLIRPFGPNGRGRQFAIYDENGDMICPFCLTKLKFNSGGMPECCEEYNRMQYEVDKCLEQEKKLCDMEEAINSKIVDAAILNIKKHNKDRAIGIRDAFNEIIAQMEKQ